MPTTAQTFYLSTTDDDQDFPGVTETVKKLTESAPGANTATTVTWTTTTITEKTVIPLAANSASGDTSNNNGWAFNDGGADGLGSVTGALRRIPSGAWDFSVEMTLNTPALLDTHALTIEANVYRVADINAGAGGARTLLFTATSANQTASATVTWSSSSQPEVLLQPGEVVLVGLTATSASTTALVLGANTNTVMTVALGSLSFVTVPSPGVETIANTVGSASGSVSVSGTLAATGAMVGTATGSGVASGALAATAATVGTAAGSVAVDGVLSAVGAMVGSAAGTSTADGALAAVGAMVGTAAGVGTATGAGATVLPTVGTAAGTVSVSGVLAAVGAMVGSAAGVGTATGSMGAVSETTGTAAGSSTATGSFAVVAPTVGTVNVSEGGASVTTYSRGRVVNQ